jgi:SAM-dependent methyltransferase
MNLGEALPDRHLDLGCGGRPRNPYQRRHLFGVDINASANAAGAHIVAANLAVNRIPFPDGHFGSVSAYDFLEHVPRILPTAGGEGTRFPFIELMNEIWRVLAPGGLLYAVTPAYPHPAAFQDPTHVNILTEESHHYFTVPRLLARMYGFNGAFELVRQVRIRPRPDYEPQEAGLHHRFRRRRLEFQGQASHLLWEFRSTRV